ncbi:MAG: hypothetical protein ACTSO9_04110 [Candidatus Helarchaeota archaeon]
MKSNSAFILGLFNILFTLGSLYIAVYLITKQIIDTTFANITATLVFIQIISAILQFLPNFTTNKRVLQIGFGLCLITCLGIIPIGIIDHFTIGSGSLLANPLSQLFVFMILLIGSDPSFFIFLLLIFPDILSSGSNSIMYTKLGIYCLIGAGVLCLIFGSVIYEKLSTVIKQEDKEVEYGRKVLKKKKDLIQLDHRKVLYGMIRTKKQIDLKEATKILKGVSKSDIQGLLYELAGEGEVKGSFDGDLFIIESDVDDFIDKLEDEFTSWTDKEEKKEGKLG